MKKKIIIISIILIILSIAVTKNISFGTIKYIDPENNLMIELPKFSYDIVVEENIISFKNYSSKHILNSEIKKILNKQDKYLCQNSYYYYDKENDLTIEKYEIFSDSISNRVEMKYFEGKYSNSECGKVVNYKDLQYSITPVNDTGYCYIEDTFEYIDNSKNVYKVNYSCFGNLAFKNGMNKYIYVDQIIKYKWLSIETLFDYLDYETKKKNFIKDYSKDGDYIIYKNSDFYLVKCNTQNGNKDIYIGKTLENNIKYCK